MTDVPAADDTGLGRDYVRLWTSSSISTLGDGIYLTALLLLGARFTHDPVKLSMITAAGTVPWVLFGLISGAVVDRVDRRRLMWKTDAVRAAVVGLLTLVLVTRHGTIWLLVGASFILATGETLYATAAQAIVPSIVSRAPERLQRANSRLVSAQIVIRDFLGRPLGGALFGVANWLPVLLNAVSYAVGAGLVARIYGGGPPTAPAQARTGIFAEIGEGLRWLWRHRLLRTLAVAVSVDNLAFTAWNAVLVLVLQQRFHLDGLGFGLMMALLGAGGVAGSLTVTRLSRKIDPVRLMIAVMGGEGVAMVVLGFARSVALAGAMLFLIGVCAIGWNVLSVSLRQSLVPGHLIGRVSSAYRLIAIVGAPIGAVLGGLVAAQFGLRAAFLFGGAAVIAAAVAAAAVIRRSTVESARVAAAVDADEVTTDA